MRFVTLPSGVPHVGAHAEEEPVQANVLSTKRVYYTDARQTNRIALTGVVLTAVGFALVSVASVLGVVGAAGLAILAVGLWHKGRIILQLESDHLQTRGMLSGTRTLRYAKMARVSRADAGASIDLLRGGRLRLPLHLLHERQRADLVVELQRRVGKVAPRALRPTSSVLLRTAALERPAQ